ncbi:MAG TPA: copper resistance system multicopper oxidase [Steroidobacteraceae bacterium]|nr:copper resistance system multicopper oxidase [Steroidobacteraceae bacterium]
MHGFAGAACVLGAARWSSSPAAILTGTQFDLTIDELPVNYTGARRTAVAINGQVPGPTLRFREGDTVTIRVTNRLRTTTALHWHGLIVPADMDGVPGVSFAGIAPGETFTYRFKVNQSGTYWYHAHARFQEQVGLYGSIVIDPRNGERHAAQREHVILFSDWTDLDPEHIYRTLKLQSDYYNRGKRTAGDFIRDARSQGVRATLAERRMWGAMRMQPTDLADVSGYAYTYLTNGVTPAGNWTGTFAKGERVRLRLINGSAMSVLDLRIPDLKLTVVAADGQDIEPVTVDELRIAAAEVYDVLVEPQHDRAYTIFAQAIDRSGYARGTLAPREGMEAPVPPLEPRPILAMSDMGMAHGGTHAGMHHDVSEAKASPTTPTVDMRTAQPRTNLDDPGPGLRDNGRRVLTYADLHTIGGPIDRREPGRELALRVTGHMQRFIWSFDGRKFSEAPPLHFTHGERLRIALVNDTMMTHPIHLHGMWSEVEDESGAFLVRKHTVALQPGQQIRYAVTADALGRWAFHCHLLYHMEAGMFREVHVG